MRILIATAFCFLQASSIAQPGGVSGSVFWVKAGTGITIGTNVSAWADQSGNGNNATQGTGANQPIFVNNDINFNPSVNFSGSSMLMNLATPPANLNTTVFTVGVPAVKTNWRTLFRGVVNDHPIIVEQGSDRLGYYDGDNGGFQNSGFTWQQNEVALVGMEMRSGNTNFRKNGTQGSSIGTINLAGLNLDYFGNYQLGGQNFGKVEETIIYTTASALTSTEKNKIESYLAIKYGLTVAHDYLSTTGTVIWDAAANAVYHNDVAGIGRDDNTLLDQWQSKSINPGTGVTLSNGGAGLFGTDRSFIVWGNDGGSGPSLNVPSAFAVRSKRVWKVAVTASPGPVTFSVDLLALGFPNTGNVADYALLIDSDTDFSSGATAYTTGASLVGNILSFTGVNFTDGNFFSIAGGNIAVPGGLATPGLVFWVKAGKGITIATNVSIWADQSGTSNNATQAIGTNQPILVNNDINFNPSVNFSGSPMVMTLATPPANLNTTIFTVGVPAVNSNWRTLFRGAASDHPIIVESGSDRLGYYDNDNGGFQNSGFTWAQNEPAIVGLEMRAGNTNFRKNGSQGSSIGSINLAGINLDYFGNYQLGTQNFGKVEETIILTTASPLTISDKEQVESYLGIKYGVTVAHNYVAADGTVVWNSATNATYHHDVAGIGRDDLSALDQRKSLSVNTGAGVTLDNGGAAFGANKSFLIWGNDAATGTSTNMPATYTLRTNRVWKVAVTGTPGTVKFSADLLALGFPNTGNASDYALLIDTDNDFLTGATPYTTGASIVGNILSFTGVNFTDGKFFSIAAGNIVLPGGTVGLNVWLKANLGPEKAAGVPAGNGDAITTWKDKSGFGRDYTTVAGPTLQGTTLLNFNPTVEILNGGFDAPAGSELATDWTLFFISQKLPSDDDGRIFDGNTGNNLWAAWGTYTNSIYIGGNPSNYNSGIATTNGIRNWHLHSYKRTSGTGQIEARADGTSLTTFAGTNSASGIRIDIDQGNNSGESSDARVGEMILYNASLTATEVNKIESYLGIKYGLTVAHDYLASDATTIWNKTTNATYHNDVAGIGRDDNTALDQRKSQSVNASASFLTLDKGGAFGTDKSFIVWGSNGATGVGTNVPLPSPPSPYSARTNRVWKVGVKGSPGAVNFSVDLSILGFPNTTNVADYALLIDTDNDFSSGATPHTTGATLVGNVLSFTGVNFVDGNYFTIAAGNVSVPGGVTGLIFWVKGGTGITIGTNVSAWADQSGNSNNASQGIGANQPILVNNDINFNPSVNFSSSPMVMNLAVPPANLNSTVFTVGVPTVNTSWRTMFRGAANDHPLIVENGSDRLGYYDTDNIGFKPSGFNWAQNETALVSLEMFAGNTNFRKNGSQGASTATINLAGLNLDYFGNYQSGTQNFGKITETLIFNTPAPLTATEKNKIESYLAVKYGLTLAHDYLTTDGTLIWDAAANATYNNDIGGIGRDDNAGLDQRKSHSVNAGAAVTLDNGGAAFGANKNFILWGSDGTVGTSANIPAPTYILRTKRVWKVSVTGAPGAVTFNIDLSALGFPNTGVASDYALLIDGDTDFSSVATVHTTGASLAGNVLTFTGVNFANGNFFTIASKNVVLPGGIAGLNVWLKANSGPEKAPGVAAGNGDAITTWKDKGGSAKDYVAVAGPTLQGATLNFNPTVEILAGGFDAPAGSELSTDWTLFFISQKLASDDVGRLFEGNTGNNLWVAWSNYTNSIYIEGSPSNYNSGIATQTGIRNWHLHSYKRTSGSGQVEARADGTSLATFAGTNSATGIRIDIDQGNYSAGSEHSNARVGEMILYSTPLITADVNTVESYLAVKYGLTVTHDYTATDGTVTWNATTNAAFHNNVTGIGRDDLTGLDQRKSLSTNANGVVTMDKGGAFGTDRSYILWGDNNGAMDAAGVVDLPAGVIARLARSWKLTKTGNPGAVAIRFDLTTVLGSKTAADLRLLVDRNTNGVYADETVGGGGIISGAVNLGGNVFEFAGVTLNSGEQITIGSVNTNTPLPITLISFNATVVDTAVKTDWSTATEINNDYFNVERSEDGLEFKSLTKIQGAGNSTTTRKYSFIDNTPAFGVNYYRLKQTDFDGTSTFSKIVKVNVDVLPSDNIKLYPNPAIDEFTLEGEDLDGAEMTLTNNLGQKIAVKGTLIPGKIKISTSGLPRGLYILTIIRNGKLITIKVILS